MSPETKPTKDVTNQGRVSVVIPTNRVDEHFLDALSSACAQSYGDLEIVVVLDGVEIPETRLPDNHRVVFVETGRPVGTPVALNRGLQASTGEFIMRLDADDLADEHRAAKQAAYLNSNPAVIAVGAGTRIVNAHGEQLGDFPQSPTGDLRRLLLARNRLIHSAMMFRASALQAIGGYNPTCTRMQDYELYLRLGRLGEIHALAETLVSYRVHPGQNSRNSSPFAPWTSAIYHARRSLAESLRVSVVRASCLHMLWLSWQVVRHTGIVRPRYETYTSEPPSQSLR